MLQNKALYASRILLFVALVCCFNGIYADLQDNEVNEVDEIIPEYYMLQGVKVYQNDRECALVGGLCVQPNDCLEPTTNHGLCPSNSYRGVECCYELPVRRAPCNQHGGECMNRCHKALMRPSTDCADGQICCVLV